MQVLYDHRYVGSNDVHPLTAKIVSSLEANAVLSGWCQVLSGAPRNRSRRGGYKTHPFGTSHNNYLQDLLFNYRGIRERIKL